MSLNLMNSKYFRKYSQPSVIVGGWWTSAHQRVNVIPSQNIPITIGDYQRPQYSYSNSDEPNKHPGTTNISNLCFAVRFH